MIDDFSELTRLNSVVRCRSKWSEDMPEEDRYNMRDYDQATVEAITAKVASGVHATSAKKRLKPGSRYRAIFRIGESTAYEDQKGNGAYKILTAKLQQLFAVVGTGNRMHDEPIERAETDFRKIRGITKSLPAAFIRCQLPPALERKVKRTRGEDE